MKMLKLFNKKTVSRIETYQNQYKPHIYYTWGVAPIASDYVTDGVNKVNTCNPFGDSVVTDLGDKYSVVNSIDVFSSCSLRLDNLLVDVDNGDTLEYKVTVETDTDSDIKVYNGSAYITIGSVVANTPAEITAYVENVADYTSLVLQASTATTMLVTKGFSVKRVIQKPNIRQLVDSGSTPKYHAESYFGRGVKFNGVDQLVGLDIISLATEFTVFWTCDITLSILPIGGNNDYVYYNGTSILVMIDDSTAEIFPTRDLSGIQTFSLVRDANNLVTLYSNGKVNGNSITLARAWELNKIGNYAGVFSSGTVSNISAINKALTPQQIQYQYNNPERFLYREDGTAKSDDVSTGVFTDGGANTEVIGTRIELLDGGTLNLNTTTALSDTTDLELSIIASDVVGEMYIDQYYDGAVWVDIPNKQIINGNSITTVQVRSDNTDAIKIMFSTVVGGSFNLDSYSIKEIKPILKSNMLTQAEIDNVVSYLPMCETDGYVRDLVGYSETNVQSDIEPAIAGGGTETRVYTKNSINSFDLAVTVVGDSAISPALKTYSSSILSEVCVISFDAVINSGTPILTQYHNGSFVGISHTIVNGKNLIPIDGQGTDILWIYFDGTQLFDISVTNYEILQLTSTYPITNYTASCRDDAKNLQSGLQTCFLKRDLLGVPYAGSFNALECDGVGYADTGWIPSADSDWQIECVLDIAPTDKIIAFGSDVYGETEVIIYQSAYGALSAYIGTVNKQIAEPSFIGSKHISMTYVSSSKTFTLYVDGIIVGIEVSVAGFLGAVNSFGLGKRIGASEEYNKPVKLFKVHTPTQNELELYNKAVTQGLLT